MRKRINLEDCDQDLTYLIVSEVGEFLKIIDVPSWCSDAVKKVYFDQWIDSAELRVGESFSVVDPRNGFTGFQCIYNFQSIEDYDNKSI